MRLDNLLLTKVATSALASSTDQADVCHEGHHASRRSRGFMGGTEAPQFEWQRQLSQRGDSVAIQDRAAAGDNQRRRQANEEPLGDQTVELDEARLNDKHCRQQANRFYIFFIVKNICSTFFFHVAKCYFVFFFLLPRVAFELVAFSLSYATLHFYNIFQLCQSICLVSRTSPPPPHQPAILLHTR